MKLFAVLAFWVLLAMPVAAAEKQAAPNPADQEYVTLIESSYEMPADFDFAKARTLYVKRSGFAPYGVMPKMDFKDIFEMAEAGDAQAKKMTTDYAFENFPMLEVHSRAIVVFEKFKDKEKLKYHMWAAEGAMRAMVASGDASSKETAMKVVNVGEEYLVARQVGKTLGQKLITEDGKTYDVLTVKPKDGSANREMWFDITDVFGVGIP